MNRREFLTLGAAASALPALALKGLEEGPLRIAHLADPQFGFDWPTKENPYPDHLRRFRAAVEIVNERRPDLLLIAGDLTHRAPDIVREWPDLIASVKVPLLICPGNHDLGTKVSAENLKRYLGVVGYLHKSVSVRGFRVIGMNSQAFIAAEPETGITPEAELAFVTQELETAKSAGEIPILASHYPPFIVDYGENDQWDNLPIVWRKKLLKLCEVHAVPAWLTGHSHRLGVKALGKTLVLSTEATSSNFDWRPPGFRMLELKTDGNWSWNAVCV